MQYVQVVLPQALKPLTYKQPPGLELVIGQLVWVPLRNQKWYTGWVVSFSAEPDFEGEVKEVLDAAEGTQWFTQKDWLLYEWMASYYLCTTGEVLAAAFPGALKMKSESFIQAGPIEPDWEALDTWDRIVIEALEESSSIQVAELDKRFSVPQWNKRLANWLAKGWVSLEEKETQRVKSKSVVQLELLEHREEELHLLLNKLKGKKHHLLELIVDAFLQNPEAPQLWSTYRLQGFTTADVRGLEKLNVVIRRERPLHALPLGEGKQAPPKVLSERQNSALAACQKAIASKTPVLLHGVTSSGKTEVYIHLIEEALLRGEQVLYLLPEIALTSQIITRLQSHFGDQVGVYHSRLTEPQRLDVLTGLLQEGKHQIILGARSALLLPFDRLGLIIVDEEHDPSFKQLDPAPRYQARDAAVARAAMLKAGIVLGSATPSMESYFLAQQGKYALVELLERHNQLPMPAVEIVNLAREAKFKRLKGVFSQELLDQIVATVRSGQQVILFQNRRGYAPVLSCTSCGDPVMCVNCDISLTYHKQFNQLKCHLCGFSQMPPKACPSCKQHSLKNMGLGTERIEEDLELFLPQVTVGRLDWDSTRTKNSYERILDQFDRGEIQVLVGTQMITKGLDFERVGLVGVLQADTLLNFPDFRAHEKAFQLLAQVAGRAGRKQGGSKVLIQTYRPDHRVLHWVNENNWKGFFAEESQERKVFSYPPHFRLIRVIFVHGNRERVNALSHAMVAHLKPSLGPRVLGPEDAPIARVRNKYHRQILIKLDRKISATRIKDFIGQVAQHLLQQESHKNVRVIYDVDP